MTYLFSTLLEVVSGPAGLQGPGGAAVGALYDRPHGARRDHNIGFTIATLNSLLPCGSGFCQTQPGAAQDWLTGTHSIRAVTAHDSSNIFIRCMMVTTF
jgi:hypothetical protein